MDTEWITPQLAQSVKQDAVAAVKSQGAALIALGQGVISDVDGLVSSLVERSVADSKTVAAVSSVASSDSSTGKQ